MELGSEYNLSLTELNIVSDNIFNYFSEYEHCFYFDSGRSALKHISKYLINYTKILLPEFICESVTDCFDRKKISYYKLKDDFTVDVDDLQKKVGNGHIVLFLMHYFGSLQPSHKLEKVRIMADQSDSIIIEDTTHSIFTRRQTIGDYAICSIRKWIPISGGGVLYYNRAPLEFGEPNYPKSTDNIRSYGMILKDMFLNYGFNCNSEYRRFFSESERRVDNQTEIYGLSDFSRFIGSCVSINHLIETRRRNFQQLDRLLDKCGVKPVVDFASSSVPLVYPIRVNHRDSLRAYLMDNKIYCAVHWPFDNHQPMQRPFAVKNAEELISLPIDQRYGEVHMHYLIDVLSRYGGDLLFSA